MTDSLAPSAPPPAAAQPPLELLVAAVEQASNAETMVRATRALAASGQGAAAQALVRVLGFNNPGAAVAAVDGLIALGPAAVEPILSSLDPRNYGARAWAVRALAGIGDVRGLEVLEEALATDVGPSVRRAAACGLGRLHLEALAAEPRQQVLGRALEALEAGVADGEWVVRYAVAVGLESLAQQPLAVALQERIQQALAHLAGDQEDTPVVRLRAGQAQRHLRGTPAPLHGPPSPARAPATPHQR